MTMEHKAGLDERITWWQAIMAWYGGQNNDNDAPATIHLRGNGFWVDPKEILDHPKARRQVELMQRLFKDKAAK